MKMDPRSRLTENPFFVLGLPPDAARTDVERAAQRLLGELELGREAARFYATPLGRAERTAERVRIAVAELRDPARRLRHEVWAEMPVSSEERSGEEAAVSRSVCARLANRRPR